MRLPSLCPRSLLCGQAEEVTVGLCYGEVNMWPVVFQSRLCEGFSKAPAVTSKVRMRWVGW